MRHTYMWPAEVAQRPNQGLQPPGIAIDASPYPYSQCEGFYDPADDVEARCEYSEVMRTYLRDVLLRVAKVSDVRELTPYGGKERWARLVEDHRASILERLLPAISI